MAGGAAPGAAPAAEAQASPPAPNAVTVADRTEPAGPETRADEWQRRRRARFSNLEPYDPAWLESVFLRLEKGELVLPWNMSLWGFYPRIEDITQGSAAGAGARFWKPDVGGSVLDLHASASFSLKGFELYEAQLGSLPHGADLSIPLRELRGTEVYALGDTGLNYAPQLFYYVSAQYRHFPDLAYFGSGPDTAPEDETRFLIRGGVYEAVAGYRFQRRWALTLRGGLLQPTLSQSSSSEFPSTQDVFSEATAPGLAAQPDLAHVTGLLRVETRDRPANPHRGLLLALQYSAFRDREDGLYDFDRFAFDARAFLPLGDPQRVLALRGWLNLDEPRPGAAVPFWAQQTLGGSRSLRGYRDFRFSGAKLLLLQAEYRWEAAPAVELAAFVDAGTVANAGDALDLDELATDWGFGLRVKTFRSVVARLDWAKGEEGSRILLSFSPAF